MHHFIRPYFNASLLSVLAFQNPQTCWFRAAHSVTACILRVSSRNCGQGLVLAAHRDVLGRNRGSQHHLFCRNPYLWPGAGSNCDRVRAVRACSWVPESSYQRSGRPARPLPPSWPPVIPFSGHFGYFMVFRVSLLLAKMGSRVPACKRGHGGLP